jgi:hypothetical protein
MKGQILSVWTVPEIEINTVFLQIIVECPHSWRMFGLSWLAGWL